MAKHILLLDIPPVTNEGIFLIDDISVYTSSLPVNCQNLQITPPGYGSPTIIVPTTQHFRLVLNACSLGITVPTGCSDTCPNIPDGVYQLYYSVAPNDNVYVSYNYLRIVSALNRLNTLLSGLELPNCLPDNEMLQSLQSIDVIRNYLISAQTNVNNEGGSVTDGVNQYRYAIALMSKMSTHKPRCVNR